MINHRKREKDFTQPPHMGEGIIFIFTQISLAMTINDVIELLEAWTPTAYAEDFDNVGLLVGDKKNTISNILVSHDCLEGTVNEAISKDCNLIICFHPIIFSGLKRLTGSSYVERTVIKAIEHKIAIYALHTALDNVPYGVNHGMCNAIGLHNCKILIPKQQYLHKLTTYVPEKDAPKLRESLFNAGLGRIGNYDSCSFNVSGTGTFKPLEKSNPTLGSINELHQENEIQIHGVYEKHLESKVLNALLKNHPYEEVAYEITPLKNTHPHIGMGMIGQLGTPEDETSFLQRLKTVFGTGGIRHSALLDRKIQKVAVLGGSGAFAISAAIAQNADILVTADLKYHDYYKAENRILLADIGHYESESFTKNIIAEYLTKKIRNFAIILSEDNTNPINYT